MTTLHSIRRTVVFVIFACLHFQWMQAEKISKDIMQRIYQEVRTPYKYGMVVAPADNFHKIDCPTVFRDGDRWMMTYVVYNGKDGLDGRGYETWLATSDDLLHWQNLGRILAFPEEGANRWDQNQRGGFPALIDYEWAGSYAIRPYKGRHYMTYIGGPGAGYEAVKAPLSIGIASTKKDISIAHQWDTQPKPIMSYDDKDAQWWEQLTQYKSTIYEIDSKEGNARHLLPTELRKHRFVMFYNAGGKDDHHPKGERIGIALSNDMKHWQRYSGNPIFAHDSDGTITGDAQIVSMPATLIGGNIGDAPVYVMFYFSAYNPTRKYAAYNTFAVSRDLVHWQDWTGPDLIIPSKPYDELFAHKSYVVKHDGVVYHYYCAVNNHQQRGIAVATSVPMGRSEVLFPQPEPSGRRTVISLNDGWTASLVDASKSRTPSVSDTSERRESLSVGRDSIATAVTLPHNFDDYYGYRQLRHGNLHGSAVYKRTFTCRPQQGKRYFLQLEGVGTYATVTLNDTQYPRELVGRTVFTLDVTEALNTGKNTLHILVDHPAMQTASPWVCGGCSSEWGFSEGSQPFGIFRPVSLIETDAVRIEPFGVHIWNNAACDSLFVETELKNYTDQPQQIELVNKFMLASGKQVFRHAQSLTLAAGEAKTLRHVEAVSDAHRWSINDPYLYNLATMIKREGKTTDEVRTPFGIRSISWPVLRQKAMDNNQSVNAKSVNSKSVNGKSTDHRFYLNGIATFINGTCEYEHLLGQSHAFSPEQIRSRVKQITNAGFNALREAHQPHNLLYQQLCDEQGILFWSQFSAHIWYDTPQFRDNFKRLLVRWVKERRNSPSVILWGLQNESVLPKDFAEECSDIIRSLDPTCRDQRAITTCNGGEGTDWNVIQNWSGTYGGSADNYDRELSLPDQLLNGEYGAWRTLDLHGDAKYSEESFTALLETKARLAERAFADTAGVCGHFQWIFNSHDNPGRTQPDGALRRIDKIGPINYKGLVTAWEEPTKAYYMYRYHYIHHTQDSPLATTAPSALPLSASPAGNGLPVSTAADLLPTAADRNRDLIKAADGYRYLARINCGGDAFTDSYGQHWQADDSLLSHSWGQDFAGIHPFQASQRHVAQPIRGTCDDTLFQFFRFGRHRLWYDIPIPADESITSPAAISTLAAASAVSPSGTYRVELYFMEPWHGRDASETADYEGLRIFDVAVNGETLIDDLDPWAEAGYCGALKRIVYAKPEDGRLRISFPEVKAGQAVICGIAIAIKEQEGATGSNDSTPGAGNSLAARPAPLSPHYWQALDTDTIARLPKSELPKDTEARPATVYQPTEIPAAKKHTTFVITPGLGQEYALRFRYKNTTGEPVTARMTITDAKNSVLVDRDVTFPPTPNKWKMLSTTTGTQINAGTYTVSIATDKVEFKEMEIQ